MENCDYHFFAVLPFRGTHKRRATQTQSVMSRSSILNRPGSCDIPPIPNGAARVELILVMQQQVLLNYWDKMSTVYNSEAPG